MQQYSQMVDIVVADGGSTDGSLGLDFLSWVGARALLTKQDVGKLSSQMRMAFDYALKEWYAGVIVIDGNGKDDISTIPNFIKKLDEGYDHIQGSRYIPGGKEENTPFLRKWGVKLLHAPLISLAARKLCTDTTNGFRAYSIKLLQDSRVQPFRDIFSTYELHYYLTIISSRLWFRTTEIPVTRAYPKEGKVPTKITGWKGNIFVLKILFQAVLWKYNPPKI